MHQDMTQVLSKKNIKCFEIDKPEMTNDKKKDQSAL